MENYNDGRIKSLNEIDNIEQALKDFSEGSEALYDLLKFCYENGIETKACCRGHEGTVSRPYILFSDTAVNYMGNIEEVLDIINAEMSYSPKTKTLYACCGIYCKSNDEKEAENFFRNLKGILQSTIENKETRVPKSIELIDEINSYIETSFFLKGKLAPKFTKNKRGDDKYVFTMLDPYAVLTQMEDSMTLEKALEELDHYHLYPCQITMDIDGLSKYAEKVKKAFTTRTNK